MSIEDFFNKRAHLEKCEDGKWVYTDNGFLFDRKGGEKYIIDEASRIKVRGLYSVVYSTCLPLIVTFDRAIDNNKWGPFFVTLGFVVVVMIVVKYLLKKHIKKLELYRK